MENSIKHIINTDFSLCFALHDTFYSKRKNQPQDIKIML